MVVSENLKLEPQDRWIYERISEDKKLLLCLTCFPLEGAGKQRFPELMHVIDDVLGSPLGYAASLLSRYILQSDKATNADGVAWTGGKPRIPKFLLHNRVKRFQVQHESIAIQELVSKANDYFQSRPQQLRELLHIAADWPNESLCYAFDLSQEGKELARCIATIFDSLPQRLPASFAAIQIFIMDDPELQRRMSDVIWAYFPRPNQAPQREKYLSRLSDQCTHSAWNSCESRQLKQGKENGPMDLRAEYTKKALLGTLAEIVKRDKRENPITQQLNEQGAEDNAQELSDLKEMVLKIVQRPESLLQILCATAARTISKLGNKRFDWNKVLKVLHEYAETLEGLERDWEADGEDCESLSQAIESIRKMTVKEIKLSVLNYLDTLPDNAP